MQWIRIVGLAMILVILISVAGALAQMGPVQKAPVAKNFEECVAAGNQAIGSNPRTCKTPDGSVFTEKTVQPHVAASPKCVSAGCSSHVCTEESEAANIVTTCEYKAEYACYRSAKCERQMNGHCGWTKTPALDTCLKNPPAVSQSAAIELVN